MYKRKHASVNDKIDVVYLHLPGVVIRPRVGLELSKCKKASKRPSEDTLRAFTEKTRRRFAEWHIHGMLLLYTNVVVVCPCYLKHAVEFE